MAYTNATFYLDYVNGNDAARTALTSVAFSNNGGGTLLATKASHGLVNGAVIDVTGTTNYNAAYIISGVTLNTFVITATYVSGQSGTVTPRGGSSWTDAWQTITTGPTAARTAAGDTILIAKI